MWKLGQYIHIITFTVSIVAMEPDGIRGEENAVAAAQCWRSLQGLLCGLRYLGLKQDRIDHMEVTPENMPLVSTALHTGHGPMAAQRCNIDIERGAHNELQIMGTGLVGEIRPTLILPAEMYRRVLCTDIAIVYTLQPIISGGGEAGRIGQRPQFPEMTADKSRKPHITAIGSL